MKMTRTRIENASNEAVGAGAIRSYDDEMI